MARFLAKTVEIFPGDRILMVVDGAGWHRAKKLKIPDTIRLIFLPPYCPDLNPVERFWAELRRKYFANLYFATLKAVEVQLITGTYEFAANPAGLVSLTCYPYIGLCVL